MNIRHFKINSSNLFYLAGIFSTMTALSLFGVTIFYWIMVISVAFQLFIKRRIIKNHTIFLFILLMFSSCFLSITNNEMSDYWVNANIKKSFVFLLTGGLISIIYSNNEKEIITNSFIKGLYISVWIQLIWGGLQFVLWYGVGFELNNVIFSKLLHMELENYSNWSFIYESGTLRLTGIGWEPAYFSMAMVVGYLLSKKNVHKLLFALICMLSTSRTGIIILLVAVVLDLGLFKISLKIDISKAKKILKFVCFIIGVGVIVIGVSAKAREIVTEAWETLIYWNKTTSGGTHFNYIKYIPNIIKQLSIKEILFGFGIASSGYPYSRFYNIEFAKFKTDWSVENDYINMLWGLGIIGMVTYVTILIMGTKLARKKEIRYILICMLIGGIFYIYYGTWLFILVLLQIGNSNEYTKENKIIEKINEDKCNDLYNNT